MNDQNWISHCNACVIYSMNMSADKDRSDEECIDALEAEIDKEVEESMKKLRSGEKIDPCAPNPYEKGSKDWWKFEDEAMQSQRNIIRKQRERHEETKQKLRERGIITIQDDARFAARIKEYRLELAARRTVARAKLANTNNNKTTNDAEMEKKPLENDIAK